MLFKILNKHNNVKQKLYEGDVLLSDLQLFYLQKRKALDRTIMRWKEVNGVPTIPYRFADSEWILINVKKINQNFLVKKFIQKLRCENSAFSKRNGSLIFPPKEHAQKQKY